MENINLITSIAEDIAYIKAELLNPQSKRWLNMKELAEYLGYSKDRLYKLKNEQFIQGHHFYNRSGKILFDRVAIDAWVVGKDDHETHKSQRQIVDNILSSIKKVS